jgi:LCP family protein required for cell wall assembly
MEGEAEEGDRSVVTIAPAAPAPPVETPVGPAAPPETAEPDLVEPAVALPVAVPGAAPRRWWRRVHHRPAHRIRHGRRWPRRLLIGANIVTAIAVVVAATAYGYVRWRYNQITSVTLPSLSPVRPAAAGSVGGPAETILIVGSDVRAKATPAEIKAFGAPSAVGGQRSDTIMLLRVDPSGGGASLLSIPRDLFVAIPGTRGRDRINTTFNKGPDLLIQAIQNDLHIEINHYIEVDFNSFRGIVNAVGGVKVWFPTPARDAYSGLNITTPGCFTLNGDTALAYVRARHYQYFQNGFWHVEPESDLARIRRQQDFVRRVMRKTLNSSVDKPTQLNGVVGAVVNNLTVDSALKSHPSELVRLTKALRVFGADALRTATLPTVGAVIGGGDVLLAQQPAADQAIQSFTSPGAPAGSGAPAAPPTAATTAPAVGVSASSVRVRVLNGSGVTGQASAASRALRVAGFVVTSTGTAESYRYATTVIRYPTGQESAASLLAGSVIGGAQTQADSSLSGGPLVLVTGASYGGISAVASSSGSAVVTIAPAPTTTAPPTTTTTVPVAPGATTNPAPPTCH